MTVDDRVKNSVEHKLLEGLWNELKSRYPLVLESRGTQRSLAWTTKFSNYSLRNVDERPKMKLIKQFVSTKFVANDHSIQLL